jgi:hypothetical protein
LLFLSIHVQIHLKKLILFGMPSVGATVSYFAGIATYFAHYAVVHGGMIGNFLAQQVVAADLVQHSATVLM